VTRPQTLGRPQTQVFTEGAKSNARAIALTDQVTILEEKRTSDGGGDWTTEFKVKETVAGRIDAAGGTGRGITAAVVSEESTHVVTMEPGAQVASTDKLEVGGVRYDVVTVRRYSGEASVMAEVRA
jgi:hypothetical protein